MRSSAWPATPSTDGRRRDAGRFQEKRSAGTLPGPRSRSPPEASEPMASPRYLLWQPMQRPLGLVADSLSTRSMRGKFRSLWVSWQELHSMP